MPKLLYTLLLIFAVSSAGISSDIYTAAMVKEKKTPVYNLPNTTGKVIAYLNRGDKVQIISKFRGKEPDFRYWYNIRINDDTQGFVYSELIIPQNQLFDVTAENNTVTVTDSRNKQILFKDSYNGEYAEIAGSIHGRYLFIALMSADTVDSVHSIIYDLKKKSIIARLPVMENPAVLSVSPSKKYVLMDSGTSAGIRGLSIVDVTTGKITFSAAYVDNDKLLPKWKSGDRLYYYIDAGRNVPGKPMMKERYDGKPNTYIQQVLWKKGKLTGTATYKKIYIQ